MIIYLNYMNNYKVGVVFGAFDLLHAGHLHLLSEARKKCDYLIVGLHVDPSIERPEKNKPIESLLERQMRLRACKFVDHVFAYETENDILIYLKARTVDVRFLGSDYINNPTKSITGKDLVEIETIESLPIHTSDLRERIKQS